jgi:hypothetical protein
MPRQVPIDQLKAKEQAAKAALEAQRKALKAAQAKRKAAEHKLLQARWREIGRLADQAGLGTLDLDVLPAAFAYLATLAQDPDHVKHWRNDTSAHCGTRLQSALGAQPCPYKGRGAPD